LNSCISMHVLAFLTGFVNLDIDFFPSFLWMKHSSLFFPTKVPPPPQPWTLGRLDLNMKRNGYSYVGTWPVIPYPCTWLNNIGSLRTMFNLVHRFISNCWTARNWLDDFHTSGLVRHCHVLVLIGHCHVTATHESIIKICLTARRIDCLNFAMLRVSFGQRIIPTSA
jgi:hypothetical protein